ncbi:hypothetical protein ABFS82_04G193800 [Erythranthe guttata]|uniref:uncharacterized protein LOC105949123 n=1 Tax=Erythranthe guttata TaxID=4155 RepID=UPI00064E108E|nr:PREDICTED: uncharacterized protein LOC105949123 [Erythranthe guttata]|eukprot:XP_012827853.1 PREDICTED: uncharacterized protein LOC105949123 [Erythranthe guttata]
MEIAEDGSATTMTTAVPVKEKHKKLKKLTIDDYLDFIDGRTHHHHLTVPQLLQILSMHGYIKSSAQKSVLIDMITTMELMDLHRSTLLDGAVSGGDDAAFTMEEAIKDLKDLDWLECHVTSLLTHGGGVASGNKAAEVAIDDGAVSAGTTVAAGSTTVSLERKITKTLGRKRKKASEVAVDDSAVSAGTIVAAEGTTVSVKPKKSKTKKANEVAVHDSAVSAGTTVAAEGTTVAVKPKKSKSLGKKASEAAVNDSIVSDGTTIDAGSTTFTAPKTLGKKASEAAANDSAVSDGTTVDAGRTTETLVSVMRKRSKGLGMKTIHVGAGTTVTAGGTTET